MPKKPTKPVVAKAKDPAAKQAQGTQALAAAFPFNANKPNEVGAAAKKPKPGATAKPSHAAVTGSTLS